MRSTIRTVSRFVCFPVFCLIVANTALAKDAPKLDRFLASGPPSGSLRYTASRPLYFRPVPPRRFLASGPPSGSLRYTASRPLYFRPVPARRGARRIRQFVDELRSQLQIPNAIRVTVVRENQRALSVQPLDKTRKEFLISIDSVFLKELDDEELRAAIAHELGHVWIFTHHPYLHTESLANEIALRAVSQESLKKVYEKLARHQRL